MSNIIFDWYNIKKFSKCDNAQKHICAKKVNAIN